MEILGKSHAAFLFFLAVFIVSGYNKIIIQRRIFLFMLQFDFAILYAIQDHLINPFFTLLMKTFTTMGNGGMIWIILSLGLLCFKKTRKAGLYGLIALILVAILNNSIIKAIVQRPRPFTHTEISLLISPPGGYSFPSGHTSSSFAAATAIFLQNRNIGIPALILAALIGFSRLYFFVHFPSDVFVGMLEGILTAFLVTKLADQARKKLASTSGKL